MNSAPGRETIMTALFNALLASVQTNFTANTAANSATLLNASTTTGLFQGLPVIGAGIPSGATIATLSPLTLSIPATAAGTAVALTTGFLTFSRRFQFWTEVSAQPALFLQDGDEDLDWPNTQLQKQTMKAEVWIYSNAGQDPDLAPITPLNNLLDAVQSVFNPDSPMRQYTLGGLVSWCRMTKIQKMPGDASGQAAAVIDVEIIVP